jgi:hypothetical protein
VRWRRRNRVRRGVLRSLPGLEPEPPAPVILRSAEAARRAARDDLRARPVLLWSPPPEPPPPPLPPPAEGAPPT